MAAAFERALALDPDNWSLLLDVADTRAVRGDFAASAELTGRAVRLEPAAGMPPHSGTATPRVDAQQRGCRSRCGWPPAYAPGTRVHRMTCGPSSD